MALPRLKAICPRPPQHLAAFGVRSSRICSGADRANSPAQQRNASASEATLCSPKSKISSSVTAMTPSVMASVQRAVAPGNFAAQQIADHHSQPRQHHNQHHLAFSKAGDVEHKGLI